MSASSPRISLLSAVAKIESPGGAGASLSINPEPDEEVFATLQNIILRIASGCRHGIPSIDEDYACTGVHRWHPTIIHKMDIPFQTLALFKHNGIRPGQHIRSLFSDEILSHFGESVLRRLDKGVRFPYPGSQFGNLISSSQGEISCVFSPETLRPQRLS